MIDSTFFILKFKIKYMSLSITAVTYFVQGKESLLQNCHRMYIMVPEYMHMNYFFTDFTYKTK